MILKNETFDKLKWIAQIGLPALAVFWYAIATIWNLPYAQEIQTTIIAVDTFLGALLGVSSQKYERDVLYGSIPDREDNK
jgi:hypothetical protein